MPPSEEVILPITLGSRDGCLRQLLLSWAGLKDNLTNYRLNSSSLVSQPASFWDGKVSTWAESEAIHPRIASYTHHFQNSPKKAILQCVLLKC